MDTKVIPVDMIGLIKGATLIYQKGKEKESSLVKVGQNTKGVYKIDGFTQ